MNNLKAYKCLIINLVISITCISIIAFTVVFIDPYIHYHSPHDSSFYYTLDNERYINDGISKNFKYNAIVTGSSMAENFKTSEINQLFDVTCIKLPFASGTYKEISDSIKSALSSNNNVRLVIYPLDMIQFFADKDALFPECDHPYYLYNSNYYDDVNYIFNKDVILGRIYPMLKNHLENPEYVGITSFDDYANWMCVLEDTDCGSKVILKTNPMYSPVNVQPKYLTLDERNTILNNIEQNIVGLANMYPNTDFYFFIPPYSIAWWNNFALDGSIYARIEAETLVIEELINVDNIKLFTFNNQPYITTNLNNYIDTVHYCEWVNSKILHDMKDHIGLINKQNYKDYLDHELDFYLNYDYDSLYNQVDYECDEYQQAIFNSHYNLSNNNVPIIIADHLNNVDSTLPNIDIDLSHQEHLHLDGTLDISLSDNEVLVWDDIAIRLSDANQYTSLFFFTKQITGGELQMVIFDSSNTAHNVPLNTYRDQQWHQYYIDLSKFSDTVYIVLCSQSTNPKSNNSFVFRDIEIY